MSDIIKHKHTPPAEVLITLPLIKNLLETQFPKLSSLPIKFVDAGWDNEMYKLGNDLVIRLPRRKVAVDLLENERTWLPKIASKLPIQIPTPKYLGSSSREYPWIWNINPWYEGVTADQSDFQKGQASKLAEFLKLLHVEPPKGLSKNVARLTLLEKKASTEKRMDNLASKTVLITKNIRSIWNEGIDSNHEFQPKLIHADLHPKNILAKDEKIQAIIDWGDMTQGDVCIDLASFWTVFKSKESILEAIDVYNPSINQIKKAKAWAVFMGIIMLDTGLIDNPKHAKIGAQILKKMDRIL